MWYTLRLPKARTGGTIELPMTAAKRQLPGSTMSHGNAVPMTLSKPKVASIWRMRMVLYRSGEANTTFDVPATEESTDASSNNMRSPPPGTSWYGE